MKLSELILVLALIGTWCYGLARAESGWKYVPFLGSLIGGVCIMEDYAIPKSK